MGAATSGSDQACSVSLTLCKTGGSNVASSIGSALKDLGVPLKNLVSSRSGGSGADGTPADGRDPGVPPDDYGYDFGFDDGTAVFTDGPDPGAVGAPDGQNPFDNGGLPTGTFDPPVDPGGVDTGGFGGFDTGGLDTGGGFDF
jgi:hypothetical protein